MTQQPQKRPLVWIYCTTKEDKNDGMPESFIRMIQEYFDIVSYEELKQNPKLGEQISGAFAMLGFGKKNFLEQQHLMPNLKVRNLQNYKCE